MPLRTAPSASESYPNASSMPCAAMPARSRSKGVPTAPISASMPRLPRQKLTFSKELYPLPPNTLRHHLRYCGRCASGGGPPSASVGTGRAAGLSGDSPSSLRSSLRTPPARGYEKSGRRRYACSPGSHRAPGRAAGVGTRPGPQGSGCSGRPGRATGR